MSLVSKRWPDPHFPRKMPQKRPSRPETPQPQESNPKILAKYPKKRCDHTTPLQTPKTPGDTPQITLQNRNAEKPERHIPNWVIFVQFSVIFRHFPVLEGDWGWIAMCILVFEGFFNLMWGAHNRNQKGHFGFMFSIWYFQETLRVSLKITSEGFLEWSRRTTLCFP